MTLLRSVTNIDAGDPVGPLKVLDAVGAKCAR